MTTSTELPSSQHLQRCDEEAFHAKAIKFIRQTYANSDFANKCDKISTSKLQNTGTLRISSLSGFLPRSPRNHPADFRVSLFPGKRISRLSIASPFCCRVRSCKSLYIFIA